MKPDDGSYLEPKHVVVNKLFYTGAVCVCDDVDTCTCNIFLQTYVTITGRALSVYLQKERRYLPLFTRFCFD
jgi:hypothetical protein